MTLGNKTGIYAQGTSYTVKHVLNAVKGSILTHMDGCMDVEAGSAEWAAALPKTGYNKMPNLQGGPKNLSEASQSLYSFPEYNTS